MTMNKRILAGGALAAAVVAIVGFGDTIGDKIGWPPYANRSEILHQLETLRIEVASVSVAALWLELQNAFASGDRDRIRRACQALLDATGKKPAGC